MLSLFRNNQFTTVIPLALYVGLTHGTAIVGQLPAPTGEPANGGALYEMLFYWAGSSARWSAIAAAILVFVQALSVNRLADEFRLLDDRSWLPGLFYALAASSLPEFLFLSPPLVAATFVPSALRRIFKVYKQTKATALVFDATFWTTVAALFYPPAIFLLMAVFAGMNVMRSSNFREQMVMLTGILSPVFLAWLWYFWIDRGGDFWSVQFANLFGMYHFNPEFSRNAVMKAALLGAIVLTVLLSYGVYIFRKLIQIQKCVAVLYWFLFLGGLAMLLQRDPPLVHFMLLMPSLGIFLAFSFSALRLALVAEFFHLVLLGIVFFIQFSSIPPPPPN